MSLATSMFQGSGQALGAAMGQRFADAIRASLDDNQTLHGPLLRYHASAHGQALYRRLEALHALRYPGFVAELEGLAEGAGVPLEQLFLVNLRGEYRGYAGIEDAGECSTCALCEQAAAVFGHNEDGSAIYRGRSYFVRVEPDDEVGFSALCYPGFLPGNAFGFNDHGVCFSVNNVRPRQVREGLGRHFMARSLFTARDVDEAVSLLSAQPRAAGFNYTLASVRERRIVNLEVSPEALHLRPVTGVHFHANHYLYQSVAQHRFASSVARQARGDELLTKAPPRDGNGVMRILRDQGDRALPIWRDGLPPDEGLTLLSALFDLDAACLKIYPGPWQHGVEPDTPVLEVALPA